GVYLPQLKWWYGDVPLRDHGLSASEGRLTSPLRDGTTAGVIEYIHHFFEFIPEEEHGSPVATAIEAHELEVGRHSYILLTTSAGLYRYDIHDVVRCVGFEGQVPVLEFLNKGAHFSSITGEKLSEFQVVSAVRDSFRELDLTIDHFTVAPVMGERPGYLLLLEPHTAGGKEEALAVRVDARLGELNCEYAEKRRTGRLEPLAIREIPPGTWDAYRRQKTAQRGNLEEFKQPCLVGDLQFVDRLLTNHRETIDAK
ncbi:MAG: GH3 auxin-responsive promoter family protein, partial [Planctomycetes bacterium]|nr:GH3 auxin-responsive promoter family protein [Planctomycetota bacterium]